MIFNKINTKSTQTQVGSNQIYFFSEIESIIHAASNIVRQIGHFFIEFWMHIENINWAIIHFAKKNISTSTTLFSQITQLTIALGRASLIRQNLIFNSII